MQRQENWEERLAAYIAERETRPFEWGLQDCVQFAREGLRAMTGDDCAPGFRSRWKSAKGALWAMKRFAGGGVIEVVERVARDNGWPEIHVLLAQRGDVVLLPSKLALGEDSAKLSGPHSAALVDLDGRFAVVPGHEGLVRVPIAYCTRAWRIS